MEKSKPLYPYPLVYAQERGELDQWRESNSETKRCRRFMDDNLSPAYHDRKLPEIAQALVSEFGMERVKQVLGRTVQHKDYDGRFHQNVKAWAAQISLPDKPLDADECGADPYRDRTREFITDVHPVIVDSLCNQIMDIEHDIALSEQAGGMSL